MCGAVYGNLQDLVSLHLYKPCPHVCCACRKCTVMSIKMPNKQRCVSATKCHPECTRTRQHMEDGGKICPRCWD